MNLRRANATMGLSAADLEKIKNIVKEVFTSDFLEEINQKIMKVVDKKLQQVTNEHAKKIKSLQDEIDKQKNQNMALMKEVDRCEQSARNLNIRIFGVPYQENENLRSEIVSVFNERMKLNIQDSQIKTCYRIKPKTPRDKPPAVLVAFHTDQSRTSVLKNRKYLKSTGVFIQEDLTKFKLTLFQSAVDKFSSKNVWCLNGNVLVKKGNDVIRVNDEQDIERI